MVVMIGSKLLPNLAGVPPASRQDNRVSITGFFSSRLKYDELRELFRKAPNGVAINTFLGGHETGFDKTDDSVLTQYCIFDDDYIKDGWYMLLGAGYTPEKYQSYFPFNATLLFLGGQGTIQLGFSAYLLDEETNDWGL